MLPDSVRIFVCTVPQDMRRSFDGLALATWAASRRGPAIGRALRLINKRSTRAKVLWWDKNGYCLLYKRLHRALFVLPQAANDTTVAVRIDGRSLAALLAGVEKSAAEILTHDHE